MSLGPVAEQWLTFYTDNIRLFRGAAELAEQLVLESIRGTGIDGVVVSARAKDPDSAREKIARKSYGRPKTQMTDMIGVRVITLYGHEVDIVANRLRQMFTINDDLSVNKTANLRSREVGYRSTHLVATIDPGIFGESPEMLRMYPVEIQIRSVVAHAWAEIEHSLRYKAGVALPDSISRRFDALAGTLELVDREFSAIASDIVQLVDAESRKIESGTEANSVLSPIALLASLKLKRLNMPPQAASGLVLSLETSFAMVGFLKDVEIATIGDFERALTAQGTLAAIRRFSLEQGVDVDRVSGEVVLGAVIGTIDLALFEKIMSFDDAALHRAVANEPLPES